MLIDTTLREGEQCHGVYFSPEDKQEILSLLLSLGVDEIELGVADGAYETADLAELARSIAPHTATSLWSPCRLADLERAAKVPVDRLAIGLPVSDAHLEERLRISRDETLKRLVDMLDMARQAGFKQVSVGLEDASRADPAFLLDAAEAASRAGAFRVRLSDTVGVCDPLRLAGMVQSIKARHPDLAVAVHCHNDFGLATGNAVAALRAGADFADVSCLGLGERAGIASLEEVVAYEVLVRGNTRYQLDVVPRLAAFVAARARTDIAPRRPILGHRLFYCETGLHVDALLKNPALYEPFDPDLLGLSRRLDLGKKSGASALASKLQSLGLSISPQRRELMLAAVRAHSRDLGRPLTDDEIRVLSDIVGSFRRDAPGQDQGEG